MTRDEALTALALAGLGNNLEYAARSCEANPEHDAATCKKWAWGASWNDDKDSGYWFCPIDVRQRQRDLLTALTKLDGVVREIFQ